MQSRLTEPIKPTGEAEIMRLPKQSYAIDYESFDSMSSYLTHIKRLKATKIEPRYAYPCPFRRKISIWPECGPWANNMTADKAHTPCCYDRKRRPDQKYTKRCDDFGPLLVGKLFAVSMEHVDSKLLGRSCASLRGDKTKDRAHK